MRIVGRPEGEPLTRPIERAIKRVFSTKAALASDFRILRSSASGTTLEADVQDGDVLAVVWCQLKQEDGSLGRWVRKTVF
jgi:hypothetical protein